MQPDVAFTEIAAPRDCLTVGVNCLSSNPSVFREELETTRRQQSAIRTEAGILSEYRAERIKLEEEAGQNVPNVQYELDGTEAKNHALSMMSGSTEGPKR